MVIIGKSIAALTLICDAVRSHVVRQNIKIINNLSIDPEFTFPNFEITEAESLTAEDLSKVTYTEEPLLLGAVMPDTKRKLVALFPYEYDTFYNKNRSIHNFDNIGDGSLVDAMVSISSNAVLGKYVTVYCNSSINHNCEIGDFVTLCPNVTVCGDVKIGEGTLIGAGAVIKNGITIGKNSVVGCGSVVIRDVPDNTTVYGNPARLAI